MSDNSRLGQGIALTLDDGDSAAVIQFDQDVNFEVSAPATSLGPAGVEIATAPILIQYGGAGSEG